MPKSFTHGIIGLCILLFIAACQQDATPIPAILPPTPTLTAVPTQPPPIRYGLAPNTAGFVPDIALLEANAQVEQIVTDTINPQDYDIVASYGIISGWTPSPVTLHITLLINEALTPMDNSLAANIVRHSPDPTVILSDIDIPGLFPDTIDTVDTRLLRTQLANAGFPDGFELVLAQVALPGVNTLIGQLNQNNLFIQPVLISPEQVTSLLQANRTHLLVTFWTTDAERQSLVDLVGENNIVDLYSLPISYQATDDLTVSFTAGGFPIGVRE